MTQTPADEQRLLAYCYRMLGSIREAELQARAAVRAGSSPEVRYRAATQACLAAPSRPLPTALAAPTGNPEGELESRSEVPWLEPIPAALLGEEPPGSVELGLIAALQHVPPLDRAAVVLRDLLSWPSADAAAVLGIAPSEVDDAAAEGRSLLDTPTASVKPEDALLDAYVRAFEEYDLALLTEVFTPDAVWEMPPFLTWVRGAVNIRRLIARHCPAKGPGDQFLVPTTANFQPAFALYMRSDDGSYRAFNLQVLSLTAAGVAHAVAFFDLSLFETFNLPDLIASATEVPGGESQQLRFARRKR